MDGPLLSFPLTTKSCSQCKTEKPLSEFSPHKQLKSGVQSACKVCLAASKKREYHKHTQRYKDNGARYRKNNPRKTKSAVLEWNYGITIDQRDEMMLRQGAKCAICNVAQVNLGRSLNIDHSHRTGRIRGLLCSECNHGLGKFRDRIDLLYRAIRYLETDSNARYPGLALGRARNRKRKAVQQG
jgi:hypothetical protein